MFIYDADFNAYYTDVKVDQINEEIQSYKYRTCSVINNQLFFFWSYKHHNFFPMLNKFKKNIIFYFEKNKHVHILIFIH